MIYLDVTIMGQPYRLACKEGEQATLRDAVRYLDGKMTALRDSGKVKGNDRIAVMAALSVAAEFLSVKVAARAAVGHVDARSQAKTRSDAQRPRPGPDAARKFILSGQIRLT